MELKDVILSTLAEIEHLNTVEEKFEMPAEAFLSPDTSNVKVDIKNEKYDEEVRILDGIRERLLVLFEGFQSPNNVQIEAKVDLTLNFLEYLLATIENRLESIKERA